MIGVKGNEEALSKFNDMKLGHKIAFIIYKVSEPDIVVDECKLKTECTNKDDYLEEFITAVKKSGEPRFSVVDWNNKLLFVSWAPENSKMKLKMLYSSSKEAFIQELVGIQIKLQATDDGELSVKAIKEKTKSNV